MGAWDCELQGSRYAAQMTNTGLATVPNLPIKMQHGRWQTGHPQMASQMSDSEVLYRPDVAGRPMSGLKVRSDPLRHHASAGWHEGEPNRCTVAQLASTMRDLP